jgi:hypothetical protein
MGARISIKLADCLQQRKVEVELWVERLEAANDGDEASENQQAKLIFVRPDGPAHRMICDCYSHEGQIHLEADFNFFRDEARHSANMRYLFENSIPFRVIPG